MNQHDARVKAFLQARLAGDQETMDTIVAGVPVGELRAFFAHLDAAVEPGRHELDVERLHTALREAGFDARESLRIASLADGDIGTWLADSLARDARPLSSAAAEVSEHLALQPEAASAVERYLRRLIEGRHDARRLTDRMLEALASTFDLPVRALEALRTSADRAGGGSFTAVAAARGNEGLGGLLTPAAAQHDDVVDELFCGRVPPEPAD